MVRPIQSGDLDVAGFVALLLKISEVEGGGVWDAEDTEFRQLADAPCVAVVEVLAQMSIES